ncbi:MAG: hypothetical protein EBR60_06685 [Burkholderiaceae bacterium]|nr:hypothetical protein [Burkholderiaceae bacterium]
MATKQNQATSNAALGLSGSAFATISQVVNSQVPGNIYGSTNEYLSYVSTTDPAAKALALQNIRRGMSVPNSGPNGQGTQYEYLQTLLRETGFIKDKKTPLGVVGPQDAAALDKIINLAVANNTEPMTLLELFKKSGVGGTGAPKQPDTTAKYNKAVSTALQYKDLTDAKQAWSDGYFQAYGTYPPDTGFGNFQTAWNAEVKRQKATTTTSTKTTYRPVIDPKTGKQVRDKSGILQYETINTGTTTTSGEGFTSEEQQAFLANYISQNFPDVTLSGKQLGGAAKTLYDAIADAHAKNFDTTPDLATVAPIIKDALGASNANQSAEMLTQYRNNIRDKMGTKYMSIQESLKAGKDAADVLNPLMDSLSIALETKIGITDPLVTKLANFKDEKGVYRLPNEFEVNQAVISDSRYGTTSRAINEGVNTMQSLRSKLGR